MAAILGWLWRETGEQRDLAQKNQKTAIQEAERSKELLTALKITVDGMEYQDRGKYELALDNFKKALSIHEKYGNPEDEKGMLTRIRNIYAALGQLEKADVYDQVLVKRFMKSEDFARIEPLFAVELFYNFSYRSSLLNMVPLQSGKIVMQDSVQHPLTQNPDF